MEKRKIGEDFRTRMPQFTAEGVAKSQELMIMLNQLAEEKNATPAQISLAWMLCKKSWIIPIPGSRKQTRLQENFAAMNVNLSDAEIKDIDERLNQMEVIVFGGHQAK